MKNILNHADLDGRLNCFGEFDKTDKVCLTWCALNISCAIAKNEYFALQIIDDPFSSIFQQNRKIN